MIRRGRGPRALTDLVSRITRPIFGKRGFAGGAILENWPGVVGPGLAAHTAPERIVFPPARRSEGTLQLRVDSGALAIELQHLEPLLVERVNTHFGFRAVARIKILQGPLPETHIAAKPSRRPLSESEEGSLAEAIAGIEDAELRSALEELGRAVIGRQGADDEE